MKRQQILRSVGEGNNDGGASMVEFALVIGLFLVVLFGIVDFGANYNDAQALRQGNRAGARNGVVGDTGGDSSCTQHNVQVISGGALLKPEHQELICLTKLQIGQGDDVRIRLVVDPVDDVTPRRLKVCAQTEMRSITGLFSAILDGREIKNRVEMRIERSSELTTAPADYVISEDAPPGGVWTWC